MKFDVYFNGMENVDNFVKKVAPEAIKDAERQAINKTLSKISTRSKRGISNATGIKPLKLFKSRFRIRRVTKNKRNGSVIFKATSFPVEILPKKYLKQFPGTFKATPKKGKFANKRERVYKRVSRTGEANQDLRPQYKNISQHKKLIFKVGNRVVRQDLSRIFHSQLQYQLQRKGYTS